MERTRNLEKEHFLQNLDKLVEIGKSKNNTLDIHDINDFFKDEKLDAEQMESVYNYLEGKNIDVLRVMTDEPTLEEELVLGDDDDNFAPGEEEEDIDLDAIDVSKLNETERRELNEYHAMVYDAIAPRLTEDERAWLRDATRAI